MSPSAPQNISQRIALNVVVSSISKILGTLFALVGLGFSTRYLGPDQFGWYVTVLAFFAFFNAIGDWGLNQTTAREISLPDADEKKIVSFAMGTRIILSGLIFLTGLILIPLLPYENNLKSGILLALIAYTVYSFYQVLFGIFQKRIIMHYIVIAELLGKIIQVSFIILAVKLNLGFFWIVASLILNMTVNCLLALFLARKNLKFWPKFDLEFSKKYLKKSVPLGISILITFIYFRADTILLSLMKPAEDVGIYGTAYKVIETLSFFPGVVAGLTMPLMAYNIAKNPANFRKIADKNFKFFIILALPLIVGTLFLADEIIRLIAGNQFTSSANLLRIVIFALALIFFGQLFNNILIAAKLQKEMMKALLVCAIFNLSLNLLFIPRFSYYATAITSVATEFLVVLLGGWLVFKKVNYLPRWEKAPQLLLSLLVMTLFFLIFQRANFLFLFLVGPLVYFISLAWFGVVSKNEILSLLPNRIQPKTIPSSQLDDNLKN